MKPSAQSDDARFLELLQKWQSGDFTQADEQALQTLARGDAFRQEALEGFLLSAEHDHAQQLDRLRLRLRPAQPREKRRWLPLGLRVAAALALLLSAWWFWRQPAPLPTDQTVALETPTAPAEQTPSVAAAPAPSEADPTAAAPNRARPEAGPGSAAAAPAAPPTREEEAKTAPTATNADMAAEPAAAPPAAAALPATDDASSADALRQESAKKESAPETVENIGEDDVPTALNSAPRPARQKAKASPVQGSEPVGGWPAFRQYLNDKARLPEAARQNNVSGVVRLRFALDAQGRPGGFTVLRGLGHGCEVEAQRLIQGYNWQRGADSVLTVDVRFIR
jgi:hypothetical protein